MCYCCCGPVAAGSLVEEKHHLTARHQRLRESTSFCAEFMRALLVRACCYGHLDCLTSFNPAPTPAPQFAAVLPIMSISLVIMIMPFMLYAFIAWCGLCQPFCRKQALLGNFICSIIV